MANTEPQHGSIQNQSETDFGDISLLTGGDPGNGTGDSVTFAAGTSVLIAQPLTSQATHGVLITGSITGVNDFDLVLAAFSTNMNNSDGSGAITIDNLNIQAVPEPSSAALLGLGMVALTLRRRA
ncbi:PEP-CTERM sorting domain-containing protein [Rubritalea spongiae]|uniref:PEP-CTERM sorting domain-containing protein n=1 Tax=Rubritalea spongiae TaxID=430797 RepID=A0ABW5DYC3_9BACT